jgi:hypothetical protein
MSLGTVEHEMHFKKLENYCHHSKFLALARVIVCLWSIRIWRWCVEDRRRLLANELIDGVQEPSTIRAVRWSSILNVIALMMATTNVC